ncbi:uncharacterized protein PG998_012116 [Apiospora kogelbergensis]|uniref:uncharacterized protein n=1 Tax=Apiospora kogelbergensis TaxID=1337665 RepID=UPI0031312687
MHAITKLATFFIAMAATARGGSVMGERSAAQLASAINFPDLARAELGRGFSHVDRDGVYRSYHATEGRVVDAARLSRAQLDAYLAALEGAVAAGQYDAAQLAADRVHFAAVDPAAVPDAQLLHPADDVVPAAKLASKVKQLREQDAAAAAGSTNGLASRQYDFCAVHNYCSGPRECAYPCYCNGVICE